MSLKLFTFIALFTLAPTALGCATCTAGDPTLNTMGMERSFAGRLRFSLDYLQRAEDIGIVNLNQTQLTEKRATFSLAYALNPQINLALRVPVVDKHLKYVNLAEQDNQTMGDVEIAGKFTLSSPDALTHQWGLIAGLRMPTATEQADNQGKKLDIDVQAGTGAWTPNAGLWYGFYAFPYFLYISGVYHHASEGFNEFQAGDLLNTTITGQYAINKRVAIQLAADSRWSAENQFAQQSDKNSGGFISFISPKLLIMPWMDVVIHLGVQIPVIDQLNGEQKEAITWQLGITYDF